MRKKLINCLTIGSLLVGYMGCPIMALGTETNYVESSLISSSKEISEEITSETLEESRKQSTEMSSESGETTSSIEKNATLESTSEKPVEQEVSLVYRSLLETNVWQDYVKPPSMSGTSGKVMAIKGIEVQLRDNLLEGTIQYRAHVANLGWQEFVDSGNVSGDPKKQDLIEAMEMKLTGQFAEKYDVYYRVHARNIGWLSWAKNGQSAGTQGYAFPIEAYEVSLIEKGGNAPGDTSKPFDKNSKLELSYQAHVQDLGWQTTYKSGELAGTVGKAKYIEGLKIQLKSPGITGNISYRSHVAQIGWQSSVSNGVLTGTAGQNKAMEAIEISLTGELAEKYDLYYRVHSRNFGWLDWAKNGKMAGTMGFGFGIEAIEIVQVIKNGPAPGSVERPSLTYSFSTINYSTHVSSIGWQNSVANGGTSGTVGQAKQLEAIKIGAIKGEHFTGGLSYSTHVQDIGWQNWVETDVIAGTTGKAKRLEAIKVKLTQEMAIAYDVYYRVHAQNFGWLDWAKNGQEAGTSGFGYRLEAIQLILVKKGSRAPGAVVKPFIKADPRMKKVQQLLNNKYNRNSYGIYVKSLSSSETAQINGNKRFIAASTGKLPIIYWTQKRINEKTINKNQKFVYTPAINTFDNAYQRGGAGILQNYPYGSTFSVDTILNWTIKYSDNEGTNFLAYYVGNRYESKMKQEISSIIGRSWTSPFSISANENGNLIEKIYGLKGEANNYLKNTVFDNQRIPKYLPVPVGHKIGDVGEYRHDIAIVYAKEPYILSVMTQNNTSYETISILSKEIYDILK